MGREGWIGLEEEGTSLGEKSKVWRVKERKIDIGK